MIINCKNCNTNYLVPDESIGINGRNVKCIKCSNTWYQDQPKSEKIDVKQKIEIEFNDKHVPVVIERTPVLVYYLSAIILSIMIITSFTFFFSNKITEIMPNFVNSRFYISDSDKDLQIKEANIEFNDKQLELNYIIENNSPKEKNLGKILITILDENKKIINSYKIKNDINIKTKEQQKISNKITDLPKSARFVSIEICHNIFY